MRRLSSQHRADDPEITVRALHDLDLLEYLRRRSRRPAEEAVEDTVAEHDPAPTVARD